MWEAKTENLLKFVISGLELLVSLIITPIFGIFNYFRESLDYFDKLACELRRLFLENGFNKVTSFFINTLQFFDWLLFC